MASTKDFISEKPKGKPIIYAYRDKNMPDILKVGFTTRTAEERVAEQYPTLRPGEKPYSIELVESAMYEDGGSFTDKIVHKTLDRMGFPPLTTNYDSTTEWFKCSVNDVKAAIIAVRTRTQNYQMRSQNFEMREEQKNAVIKTKKYFERTKAEGYIKAPKFLWNAKMRFGKTFAAYQLAKEMNFKKILILTFKPAVQSAWRDDLLSHIDFEYWQFIARPQDSSEDSIDEQYEKTDKNNPIVCFGSFQDFLGKSENGGIKPKNEWVHTTNWDLVIFDEYHFGAWRDNAKHLFENEDEEDIDSKAEPDNTGNNIDETWLPITTKYYLYLSGTPFRALNSGEFIEEQIFSWTYSDEQRAKEEWSGPDNPYAALPKMIMFTYKIPDSIQEIAKGGEYDEFDLNEFFRAELKEKNKIESAEYVHKEYVQKWLNLIRGSFTETAVDDLKLGAERPPMPFSDTLLMGVLNHTLWFLPNVASCYAMKNLLEEKQNLFYQEYKIIVCAGTKAGIGLGALPPVLKGIANGTSGTECNPLKTKSITLSCGKLTTGVTIRPWSGIFMLRNLNSPETYFQSAFRVQSPWTIQNENGETEIVKKECFVFDFALNRALRQISDYSRNLSVDTGDKSQDNSPEVKVAKFIQFLPVLAYDGSSMRQVNAGEILDIAMAGTTATLLAKRWESALLVNVDNETLLRLKDNQEAMDALMKIEGFRSLNKEIETIINKSEKIKKAKTQEKEQTQEEKREVSQEEKEMKSLRKQIQEKLIKFATRIPVFMYLSDYREHSLKDVITQLEPQLFYKVTGLTVKDFELLVSLNVFNANIMDQAVYSFKRYEDSSLSYTGIDRHEGESVGLFSTVLSAQDYKDLAQAQGLSV